MVIKGQRMRLTFRASAGLWEHNAWQQLFLASPPPPSALGDAHKPKSHATNVYDFLQRLKTYIWPILPSACFHITRRNTCAHTHQAVLSVHLQAGQSRLASQHNCRLWKYKKTADQCRLHQDRSLTLSTLPNAIFLFRGTELKLH